MAKHVYKAIIKQYVTEKATVLGSKNQYVFKIHPRVNKLQVKAAVEEAYNVKVAAINTVNMLGKSRRYGAITGKKSDWKKAYVTLMEGYSIEAPSTETQTVKD